MAGSAKEFVTWFKSHELTLEERNLFTGLILDKLGIIPLRDIITNSDAGEILINGEPLELERAKVLHQRASSALDNEALKLAWEQTRWLAFRDGLATGLPPEGLLFYRAALWFSDQTKAHLRILAQRQEERIL